MKHTPELKTWNELPVWAALMINKTARGLTLPDRWEGWRWSDCERDVVVIHAAGFVYSARRGAPWVR